MKEQAYNIIKTKDSRTQRQSNLNKSKEEKFKISPQEFKDHTLGRLLASNMYMNMEAQNLQDASLRKPRFGGDFGDKFLKLSFDSSLVSTAKDTTDAEIKSLLEPTALTPVQQSPSIATATTLPPPSVSTTPSLRVAKLEKDVSDLKKIDISAEALAALKIQFPSVVDNYLGSKQIPELPKKQTPTVDLEQESEKSHSDILKSKKEQAEKQNIPKFTIKSTDQATLKEYDQKSALYQTMHPNKSFNRNPANHRLYHALIEALIEDENAMDKGVADTVQDHKRKHDDDEDPPAEPNQGKKIKRRKTKDSESSKKPSTTKETSKGKSPSKGFKIGKSAIEELIAEVVMDDAGDDVGHDDDQPQDISEPKTTKTSNLDWFTQPPRPPTPDPEWNKH
ncbi:hypothetical protein Tco_1022150 [Tanacetum coccineum]